MPCVASRRGGFRRRVAPNARLRRARGHFAHHGAPAGTGSRHPPVHVAYRRPMRWLLAFCLVVSLPVAACSGSTTRGTLPPDGGGGSGGTTQGVGGVALGVSSVSTPLMINNTPPSGGNAFEELDITLQNKSSSTPVSANFALFTLSTDQSLVLNASALSGSVTPACSPTTSVASGGSFTCKLAFEVPTGQKGTILHYDDNKGHKASASVPAPPTGSSSSCQQYMALAGKVAQNPQGPCAQCLMQVEQSGGTCASEFSAANTACGSNNSCQNSCNGDAGIGSDPAGQCSCYQGCSTSACWSAANTAMQCALNACASSC